MPHSGLANAHDLSLAVLSFLRMNPQERVDLVPAQHPIIVEIGDDLLHERLREPDRALPVAELFEQDGERELLRALALVSPLEPEFGETLDLVVLVKRPAIDRHHKAVDR